MASTPLTNGSDADKSNQNGVVPGTGATSTQLEPPVNSEIPTSTSLNEPATHTIKRTTSPSPRRSQEVAASTSVSYDDPTYSPAERRDKQHQHQHHHPHPPSGDDAMQPATMMTGSSGPGKQMNAQIAAASGLPPRQGSSASLGSYSGSNSGTGSGHASSYGLGFGPGVSIPSGYGGGAHGADSDVESNTAWSPAWSPAIDPDSKSHSPIPPPYMLNSRPGSGAHTPFGMYGGHSQHNGSEEKNGGSYSTFPLSGPGPVGHGHGQPYNYPTIGREVETQSSWEKMQDSTAYWLCLYFFFNLGLTLFNKIVLVSFPFPYTLTGLHALSGCAGCYVALERGAFTPARLTSRENIILAAFSVLYTINIAVSNISLQLVTVPFHQVVRASTPLFTILISTVLLRSRFSVMKLVSLLPVVAGVGFATYGDYYFTAWGLILTLLGTFLAALKTVVTNLIQTGGGGRLKLHPLDLLMRMSPLAFIQCVVYGWWSGELEKVRKYGATQMTRSKAVALLINGVIACGLNIVSFTANKKAGALTMTVSANCKQVLTIALAVVLFDLHINFTNGIGIILTLVGGGWYGWVEFQEKQKKTRLAEKS